MISNIFKCKTFLVLLIIAILLGNFPIDISSAQGSVTNEEATPATIHPRETSYPEPIPTIAPTESDLPEDSFNHKSQLLPEQNREPSSSRSSLPDVQDEEAAPVPALKIMEDPDIKILSEQYTSRFGNKELYLSEESIKELLAQGASFLDIYAIAFLQELYEQTPSELWQQKKESRRTWAELADALEKKSEQPKRNPDKRESPTEVVYGEDKQAVDVQARSVLGSTSNVSNAVYGDSFPFLKALNVSMSSVIQGSTIDQMRETFKEQYSDHYGTSESIDPATGSLTWKDNQISLPGRDGLDLNVGVFYRSTESSNGVPYPTFEQGIGYNNNISGYNHGDLRSYLGLGWSFRFPSMETENWTNKYYHDGEGGAYKLVPIEAWVWKLKDYPKGDIKITLRPNPFEYVVEHGDKRTEYYSNNGELTKITDRFGNEIVFTYTKLPDDKNVLKTITDSLGRKVYFNYYSPRKYDAEGETITLEVKDPNNELIQKVIYKKHISDHARLPLLKEIEVQNGDVVSFEYDTVKSKFDFFHKDEYAGTPKFLPYQFLKRIKYNETSETIFKRESAKHSLSSDGFIEQDRIIERYDLLNKNNGTSEMVNRIKYAYEGEYTNYPVSISWPDDPLPAGYTFSSAAMSINREEQVEKVSKTVLNNERKTESVETTVLSGLQAGERKLEVYSNFHPKFKYNPTVIEQRIYSSAADASPLQLFTDVTYDDQGYVVAQTAPLTPTQRANAYIKEKYTTRYSYESAFHFLSAKAWYQNETDTAPNVESYSYTGQGRVQSTVNALGEVNSYTYEMAPDGTGKLWKATEEKSAGGKVFSKTTTTYGAETKYAYPTSQELFSDVGQTSQQIILKKMAYDVGTGRLIRESDGNNQTTSYEYDAIGRLQKVTYPPSTNLNGDKYNETQEYHYSDNQVSIHFDTVNAGTRSFVVDEIRTLTHATTGSTIKTYGITFYNGLGQALLEERFDQNQGKYTNTQYHYDEWQRPVYAADAAGNVMKAGYDGWGQQNQMTDAFRNLMVSDINTKLQKSTGYLLAADTGDKLNYVEQNYDQWGNLLSKRTYKDWPNQS